ncbi:MAG: pyridoxine 5'-phosphate synthase, partial [Ilumatobacteraceae bacterium]
MTDDLRIELIDDDPTVFGPVTVASPPQPRPHWVVPSAVLACLAVAAVGLVVWAPWHHASRPPMSNRLVLSSQPFNEVLSVMIDAAWVGPSAGEVGLVYADADAVFPRLRDGSGRSLRWVAYAADSASPMQTTSAEPIRTVQGTLGIVSTGYSGSTQLDFGPIDGRRFTVVANGLSPDEMVAIAVKTKPHAARLVPERRTERTTEGGLDV